MSRRRTAEAPAHEATADEIVQSVADSTHIPEGHSNGQSHAESVGGSALDRARARLKPSQQPKAHYADPVYSRSIPLTADKDGEKIHLERSNKPYRDKKGVNHPAGKMVIRFDKKPEGDLAPEIFEALRAARFDFDYGTHQWEMPIDPAQRWKSDRDAEKMFHDIAASMREVNGLPPEHRGHSPA